METTQDRDYSDRLENLQRKWWKRLLPVQLPYKLNLRSLKPGFTLEIGCGIGRNLGHLNGNGVGIDHNQFSVEQARKQGFTAFLPEEFLHSEWNKAERFDSILLSHVLEHMTLEKAKELLAPYLPLLRRNGKVIMITPQEVGYRSDPTHVDFMDFGKLKALSASLGIAPKRAYSFPFPRVFGRLFIYNEFVVVSEKT